MSKVILCFLPVVLLGCGAEDPATAKLPGPPPYDYEGTKLNFKRIARSIQLYRQEAGFVEAGQRKSYSDAGLPESIVKLTERGHAWTLPESSLIAKLRFAHFPGQSGGGRSPRMDFQQLYKSKFWPSGVVDNDHPAWSLRGDEIPILLDINPWGRFGTEPRSSQKVVILRLNGKVEEADFRLGNESKLVMKQ